MQRKMARASKIRASKQPYISQSQLRIDTFKTPFEEQLNPYNRWVQLANRLPWDKIVSNYQTVMNNDTMGASNINPRVAIGALIIKHLGNLSHEETVFQMQENTLRFAGFIIRFPQSHRQVSCRTPAL